MILVPGELSPPPVPVAAELEPATLLAAVVADGRNGMFRKAILGVLCVLFCLGKKEQSVDEAAQMCSS